MSNLPTATLEAKALISILRALVLSRNTPTRLRDIIKDYRNLEGRDLDCQRFGYPRLEDFLGASDEFVITKIQGETFVTAKRWKESAHISQMISKQRNPRKKSVLRVPKSNDQSWNKTTYSNNVFKNLRSPTKLRAPHEHRSGMQRKLHFNESINDKNNNAGTKENRNSSVSNQRNHQSPSVRQTQKNNNSTNRSTVRPILGQNSSKQSTEKPSNIQNRLLVHKTFDDSSSAGSPKLLSPQVSQNSSKISNRNVNKIHVENNISSAGENVSKRQHVETRIKQNESNERSSLASRLQHARYSEPSLQLRSSETIVQSLAPRRSIQNKITIQQNNANNTSNEEKNLAIRFQRKTAKPQVFSSERNQTPNVGRNLSSRLQNARISELPSPENAINPNNGFNKQINQQIINVRSVQDRLNAHKMVSGDLAYTKSAAQNELKQDVPTLESKSVSFQKENVKRQLSEKIFNFEAFDDPIMCLGEYCHFNNYDMPAYEYVKLKFSNKYQARVLVNGVMYCTYPDEYQPKREAEISVAMVAVDQIREEQAKMMFPICLDSDYEIAMKLFEELKEHPNGMFCKDLPDVFKEKYKERLPDNWFSIIQSNPQFFSIEEMIDENLIIFARTKSAESSAASSVSAESDVILERIVLPWEKKYWDLYVTHTVTTVEVWARLIGEEYNQQLNSLLDDIEISMLTDKARPTSIACGQIYLVSISECWYRVLVQEINKSAATCMCFFLDEGEEKWFDMDQLFVCDPKFLRLPAQAIPFSLFGLEDFAENPNAKRHLDNLLARKPLIGEILARKSDYEQQLEDSNEFEAKIQVVLYDTSSDDDVNLNPLILSSICDDTPAPELKRYTNVQVTNICKDGDVYLQVKNFGPIYVEKLIRQLVESKCIGDQHRVIPEELSNSDDLFLIKDGEKKWFRAALMKTNTSDKLKFEMFCVDFGFTKIVTILNIFRLNSLSAALSKFPRQAIKVRLHNLPPLDDTVVARIRGLLPQNAQTFAKVVVHSKVPQVIIYKRLENDNFFNINDDIYVDYELESERAIDASQQDEFENVIINRNTTIVPASPQKNSLPKLEFPKIPEIGGIFNVFISMAPQPGYFFVLPDDECRKLRDLMKDIQAYYSENDEFIPADVVEVGEAYAVSSSDGQFYRVIVQDVFGPGMVHICYCDFGDVDGVSNDKLRILPAKFRTLPRLAFVAKLYGVKPKDGDWTTEDCLRFQSLTEKKRFVSKICKISPGNAKNSQVLEIDLIDVTTDEDIFISSILVSEGRAVEDPSVSK